VIEKVALNPPIDDRKFESLDDPRGRARTEPKASPR